MNLVISSAHIIKRLSIKAEINRMSCFTVALLEIQLIPGNRFPINVVVAPFQVTHSSVGTKSLQGYCN